MRHFGLGVIAIWFCTTELRCGSHRRRGPKYPGDPSHRVTGAWLLISISAPPPVAVSAAVRDTMLARLDHEGWCGGDLNGRAH